ncbi:MAG: ABC transporter ATP-binding protein [Alphaproteobacteria bacterium]|nr:ABC transporter ATP-binding protein [Alphaproteobacteria bacterium]
MAEALLTATGLSKSFRGLKAVNGVSFSVGQGEILAMIGPNGAGKTTCFNLIAGAMRPDAGEVRLAGQSVTGLRADQICRAGIGRTFQLVKPFAGLSVLDNVTVGALNAARHVAEAKERARAVLDLLDLGRKIDEPASSLTLPDRKRLEVARALATGPKLLLLDEVMAGLRPTECDRLVEILAGLNRRDGLTILLIEHVMRAVMKLAQRILVLHHGEQIAEGSPEAVVRDPAVLDSYLGEEAL